VNYLIEITSKAEKDYLRLPKEWQDKARSKILTLEDNPRPYGSKKLKSTDFHRLRVGDYRVVYSIYEEKKLVKILSIGHRKEVYR
jgi:mRNA interferase RelE/StbE